MHAASDISVSRAVTASNLPFLGHETPAHASTSSNLARPLFLLVAASLAQTTSAVALALVDLSEGTHGARLLLL